MGPFQQIPQLEKLLLRLRNGKGTPQLDRQQPANRLLGYPIFYNQRTDTDHRNLPKYLRVHSYDWIRS